MGFLLPTSVIVMLFGLMHQGHAEVASGIKKDETKLLEVEVFMQPHMGAACDAADYNGGELAVKTLFECNDACKVDKACMLATWRETEEKCITGKGSCRDGKPLFDPNGGMMMTFIKEGVI